MLCSIMYELLTTDCGMHHVFHIPLSYKQNLSFPLLIVTNHQLPQANKQWFNLEVAVATFGILKLRLTMF